MNENAKSRLSLIAAIGMLLLAGLFLFSVKTNALLFSHLPNTGGWLIAGTYIPYALILIAVILIVRRLIKTK